MPASEYPHLWIVAITGGIGSGKSVVASALARLGGHAIVADELAHEVTRDPQVLAEIARSLGPNVLQPDGQLDRAAVADLVFRDPEKLSSLNQIVHPRVQAKIYKELAKWEETGFDSASPLPGNRPLIILDIPLLERSPFLPLASTVVFVDAPWPDRVRRVRTSRGWSEAELQRREASQVSLAVKRKGADSVIENPDPRRSSPETSLGTAATGTETSAQETGTQQAQRVAGNSVWDGSQDQTTADQTAAGEAAADQTEAVNGAGAASEGRPAADSLPSPAVHSDSSDPLANRCQELIQVWRQQLEGPSRTETTGPSRKETTGDGDTLQG